MKFDLARTRIGAAALTAFTCGLIFAAGFDLTPFSHAQAARLTTSSPVIPEAKAVADLSNSFVAIAEAVTPAVVSIQSESKVAEVASRQRPERTPDLPPGLPPGFEEFFRDFPREMPSDPTPAVASGTGFIVSTDGYILTNNHVVTRSDRTTRQDRVTVKLNDGREFSAAIIGNDAETDVAVLKIDARNLPTVALGDDNSTRIGEWVLAIGNPLGLDFTVTAGIVSAKGRNEIADRSQRNQYAISDFIQTDAAINPGNSGGPLINIRGEVIGINSAIASRTGYYQGYGFAIPITLARDIMNNLIEYGRIRASILGVSIRNITAADAQVAGLKSLSGVLVGGLSDSLNSPAGRAGIEAGDVIIEVNSKPIDRTATLQRTIRSYAPGTTVDVKVMRYGKEHTIRVKLEERPSAAGVLARSADEQPESTPPAVEFNKLGISVEPLTSSWMQENRLSGTAEGLRVVDSSPDSRGGARLLGLVLTEVIYPAPRRALKTEADLKAVLDKAKEGDVISFRVRAFEQGTGRDRGQLGAPFVLNVRVGDN